MRRKKVEKCAHASKSFLSGVTTLQVKVEKGNVQVQMRVKNKNGNLKRLHEL